MPKAGTHLVVEILSELGRHRPISISKPDWKPLEDANHRIKTNGAQNHLFVGHFRCRGKARLLLDHNWKILVLIRDPRDVVLSLRDYLQQSSLTEHSDAFGTISSLSREDQIKT